MGKQRNAAGKARRGGAGKKERTLQVTGVGHASARPDAAELRLGVSVRGSSAREARDLGAETAASVLAALVDTGLDEADVSTVHLSLDPVYESPGPGYPPVLAGYQLSHVFLARVRDVALAADALDAAVLGGATSVESIGYRVADEAALEALAREAAVADARATATALAAALGVALGSVRTISEGGTGPAPRPFAARAMLAAADAPTPMRAGDVEASAVVSIVFDIE